MNLYLRRIHDFTGPIFGEASWPLDLFLGKKTIELSSSDSFLIFLMDSLHHSKEIPDSIPIQC